MKKAALATLLFGLFSMQSALAADCYSYTDYESLNNSPAACIGSVAQQSESVVQDTLLTAFLQSSWKSGNEYAAAV